MKTITVNGKIVVWRGIDVHTPFQMPYKGMATVDDLFKWTKAAITGGTTMIVGHVVSEPESGLS